MTIEDWDIDRFPLKVGAQTPGQRDAERWLNQNSEESIENELRPIQPGDLDRLTRQHEDDPADRFFGVNTSGGGLGHGQGMHYPSEGYNAPDRNYPGESPEAHDTHWADTQPSGYHMPETPEINDLFYDDDDEESETVPETYHIVTRPRNAIPGVNAFDEHEHHRLGNPYFHEPEEAMNEWESRPESWNYHSENPDAEHEIVSAHPAERHDEWRNQLRSEDEDFSRIAQHGFERESADVPGHRAYRHEDPHGGIHRLWHNTTHYTDGPITHGPGWRTSYYVPGMPQEQQLPWTFHDDDSLGDSLGDALDRVDRNKAHADVMHSGTGLKPVENLHGRHYVSKRPDGSTQQLLMNLRGMDGEHNWFLAHYNENDPQRGYHNTEHGADLHGALEQARRNLARG